MFSDEGLLYVVHAPPIPSTADTAVYFPENTVSAPSGSTAVLEASLYTSSFSTPTVQWYYQGSLIDTENNERYSTPSEEDSRLSLSVVGVASDVLGVYTVSVTVGGSTENATVYLEFPGELINCVPYRRKRL